MLGPELSFVGQTEVLWEGGRYTFFGGNDYHRLSRHPEVVAALKQAADEYGIGSAGSRSTTANHPLYLELEAEAAKFFGTEAAAVQSAGYISNAVVLQALQGEFSHLFLDEIAHSSLVEAAMQTGLPMIRFRHRDPEHLAAQAEALLADSDTPLVLTDGVFAATGQIAPLGDYLRALRSWPVKILVDDAHGMATVGSSGKGCWEQTGAPREAIFQTGTFSKGLGSFGGLITGDRALVEKIQRRSSAFTGSTPMPMPLAAASLKSLRILRKGPEAIARVQERSIAVKQAFRELGFPTTSPGPAPICSVTFLDVEKNRVLGQKLKAAGIYPVFINYPGAPPGGHFRFTMSSAHSDEEIGLLTTVVADCARELRS
jgi:7-keto-8-aminopelargonate synthetase-like enzyme